MFLRNHVHGWNKIQDEWNNISHKVIGRLDPKGNVYVVEPLEGAGPQKTVNHSQLLDSRTLVREDPHSGKAELESPLKIGSHNSCESDDCSNEDYVVYLHDDSVKKWQETSVQSGSQGMAGPEIVSPETDDKEESEPS